VNIPVKYQTHSKHEMSSGLKRYAKYCTCLQGNKIKKNKNKKIEWDMLKCIIAFFFPHNLTKNLNTMEYLSIIYNLLKTTNKKTTHFKML